MAEKYEPGCFLQVSWEKAAEIVLHMLSKKRNTML